MQNLTPLQSNFLNSFFVSHLKKDFFLSGGTALSAFYLHHRKSDDIDLFTINQEIELNVVSAELLKIIHRLNGKIINQVSSATYLQFIFTLGNERLKVDIVKDTPTHFGRLNNIGTIIVDSLENIAVGKLLALYGRADAKDFIDIYFLLEVEKKITFNKLFSLAKLKDSGLHEFYLAEMLSKVSDLQYFPKMLISINKKAFKTYFIQLSNKLYQKIKPKK